MAQQPLVGHGLLIIEAPQSHSETLQSVGFFWISDRPDAETSTWQISQETNTDATGGFEPAIPANERPQTHALGRAATGIGILDWCWSSNPNLCLGGAPRSVACKYLKSAHVNQSTEGLNMAVRILTVRFSSFKVFTGHKYSLFISPSSWNLTKYNLTHYRYEQYIVKHNSVILLRCISYIVSLNDMFRL